MPEGAARPWVALAFDYGRKRIGVAAGDSITRRARPVATIRSGPAGVDWSAIERAIEAWQPNVLVVGLPCNADGSPAALGAEALRFARELERRHAIPTQTVDERWSSLEAAEHLKAQRRSGTRKRRLRREDMDPVAAGVILERWLTESAPQLSQRGR